MKGRVLIIAGSDPSGGAGLQADIKTVSALGGYAMTAVTAITVQNTQGVTDIQPISPAFIRAQIDAVAGDIGIDAIKVGMIAERDAAIEIAKFLKEVDAAGIPIVLDPVLGATSGDALAGDGVAGVIYNEMLACSTLATPNADELAVLSDEAVPKTTDELLRLGEKLVRRSGRALLLKGGHIGGDEVVDILLDGGEMTLFRNERIDTTSTHGTGCTLASAIATKLAQGASLVEATKHATSYVHQAIKCAPGFGNGHGPLNHAWSIVLKEGSS